MPAPDWAVDEGGDLDITIPQGRTFRLSMVYAEDVNDADPENPIPVNPIALAGLVGRAQIRRFKSKTSDLVLDLTPYVTLEAGGETGAIDIDVPANVTVDVTERGYWDLELHNPATPSEVAQVVKGRAALDTEVTV